MRSLQRTPVTWALLAAAVRGLGLAACSDAPTTPSAPPTFEYETIDVPGGILTDVEGISGSGTLVGAYWTTDGRLHGFVKEGRAFTTIDYPGAYYTQVRGIEAPGELVGDYAGVDEGEAPYDEFRMSPNGGLQVVGFHYTSDHNQAHLRDRGSLTVFMVPGATMTEAWDMNARGEIAGNATVDGKAVGFVRTGETDFTTLTYPAAVATYAAGINDDGDIVGTSVAVDSSQHGYIARRVH